MRNLRAYLENRIRGWLPKEPNLYRIKRTMNPKILAVYFVFLFAVGILLRIFIMPLFLPDLAEATNLSLTLLAFMLLALFFVVVYYLKTQGSPKQIRSFYALAIGLGLGFPIFAVVTLVFNAVTGHTIQGTNLLLDYVFSYTVAFIIGIQVSKKMQRRWLHRS